VKNLILLIVSLLILGCATAPKSTLHVTKPEPIVVENERYFDIPFDEVWQRLVADLSRSFFVINNISKESNLINLSFSAQDAESYVDCGSSSRTYKGETYTYEIAGPGSYKIAQQAGNNAYYVYDINRDTDLEGRINVYVAPEDNGTRVSVNVKYIFNVTSTGTAEAIAGVLQISHGQQNIPKETSTISFNTNQEGVQGDVSCFASGRLETMILDMVEQ